MNHYLKQAAVVGVLSTVLAGVQLFAFTEPTLPPPAGNLPAPVTTGGTGQVKPGDLTISKPDNSALFTTDKLVSIGGAILNTGGALNGLIVDKGNVGIGTAAPQAKLDVLGTIKVLGDSQLNGNVTVAGNIGVGTQLPRARLDVSGDISITGGISMGPGTVTDFTPSNPDSCSDGIITKKWSDRTISNVSVNCGQYTISACAGSYTGQWGTRPTYTGGASYDCGSGGNSCAVYVLPNLSSPPWSEGKCTRNSASLQYVRGSNPACPRGAYLMRKFTHCTPTVWRTDNGPDCYNGEEPIAKAWSEAVCLGN